MTSQRLSWKGLASLMIGGAVCLPTLMVGQALMGAYGLQNAFVAILVGNLVLLGIGLGASSMSVARRQTTTDNALADFGTIGSRLFAITIALSMAGWFAIQLNLMSLSLGTLTGVGSPILYNLVIGALITGCALVGIRGLATFAIVCTPLLGGTLVVASIFGLNHGHPVEVPTSALSLSGTSLVIAAAMAFLIDLPTYFRHAQSKRAGRTAILVVFGLALPLIELVGVWLAYRFPGANIIESLTSVGPLAWVVWVSLFLFLAGWTTNNVNLFSATTALRTAVPRSSQLVRTVVIGGCATGLACLNILAHFEPILIGMGSVMGSFGSVILMRYCLRSRSTGPFHHTLNLTAWGIGAAAGLISQFMELGFVGLPIIDGCAMASLTTGIMALVTNKRRKVHERAVNQ